MDIYAHRGSTVLAPENTLPAFEWALKHGADVLEIDVRLSRDNRVIVIHDARVDRTCDGQGAVRDLTFQQLKRLNAGFYFKSPDGRCARGEHIRLLSLDELLDYMPETRINIDIKDAHHAAASAVATVIELSGKQDNVNVGSFHSQCVAWFRELAPQVTTAATLGEAARLYFGRSWCKNINYQYLQIPTHYYGLPLATKSFVEHAKGRGVQCVYWTINEPKTMQALMNLGVSGLVTDRVDIAEALLANSHYSQASKKN